jgi:hypothetical protein
LPILAELKRARDMRVQPVAVDERISEFSEFSECSDRRRSARAARTRGGRRAAGPPNIAELKSRRFMMDVV